ncbi:hypothetical protein MMC07_009283 [Pseudocyphellaria aurata]|nr:hypothetical protein [Pseudocyphellaria aurata]
MDLTVVARPEKVLYLFRPLNHGCTTQLDGRSLRCDNRCGCALGRDDGSPPQALGVGNTLRASRRRGSSSSNDDDRRGFRRNALDVILLSGFGANETRSRWQAFARSVLMMAIHEALPIESISRHSARGSGRSHESCKHAVTEHQESALCFAIIVIRARTIGERSSSTVFHASACWEWILPGHWQSGMSLPSSCPPWPHRSSAPDGERSAGRVSGQGAPGRHDPAASLDRNATRESEDTYRVIRKPSSLVSICNDHGVGDMCQGD